MTVLVELKNETANTTHPKTGKPITVNIRFQGQTQDRETGLYYNYNRFSYRYYDPHAGRYINHDPIGLMGGLNQYQYCPNPVEWIDPLGLSAKECEKKYRALTESQAEEALAGKPITPKDINASYTVQEHISNGRLETQYNSLGSKKAAEFYAKANPAFSKFEPSILIEIDLKKINTDKIYDASKGLNPETGDKLENPAYHFARKDKEILVEGAIPPEAYKVI